MFTSITHCKPIYINYTYIYIDIIALIYIESYYNFVPVNYSFLELNY